MDISVKTDAAGDRGGKPVDPAVAARNEDNRTAMDFLMRKRHIRRLAIAMLGCAAICLTRSGFAGDKRQPTFRGLSNGGQYAVAVPQTPGKRTEASRPELSRRGKEWVTMYDRGFAFPGMVSAWTSTQTSSKHTPDGLHISDPSTEKGSGRFYYLDWDARPDAGAFVEAKLKSMACSGPWGMVLFVSDGVHEEGVTFYPDRVMLAHCGLSAPFDCADRFHTFTLRFKGSDISVKADGVSLIEGKGRFTTPAVKGRNRIGFGAAASGTTGEAVWRIVRFQGPKPEVREMKMPNVSGLGIARGETQILVPNSYYKSIFAFRDGDIVVGGRRSSDGGKTWRKAPAFHTGAYQFPDGEIVQLGFLTHRTDKEGVFRVDLSRSTDNGITLKHEKALLTIPDATSGTADNGTPVEGPACDHAIVGLSDGSILAALYGWFKTDTVLCPSFPKKWKVYKYRTFVVRSTDRGRTWNYLSTVAYDPSVGLESFCEPDLLKLPSGEILCFMRTGGSGGKHTPLTMNRSRDDGKTWSKPIPIADRGVWPNACRMQNGVLVVTYGRPGNWLAFSLDDGHTWIGHFCFYQGGLTTSYNSVAEVAPDRLLVVYDRTIVNDDGERQRDVVGTYFRVGRK